MLREAKFMMPIRRLVTAVLGGFLIAGSLPAVAVVIDFNHLVGTGLVPRGDTYSEDGFRLDEIGSLEFLSIHEGDFRFTGTVSFLDNTINGTTVLTQEGGGSFDLTSIDLDSANGPQNVTVTFVGTLAGGGVVTQTFITDATHPGLQTFTFAGFDSVTEVRWDQIAPFHSFDNIVINQAQVPEPVTLALLGIGLAGLGFSRRKRATR